MCCGDGDVSVREILLCTALNYIYLIGPLSASHSRRIMARPRTDVLLSR